MVDPGTSSEVSWNLSNRMIRDLKCTALLVGGKVDKPLKQAWKAYQALMNDAPYSNGLLRIIDHMDQIGLPSGAVLYIFAMSYETN
jgi:hypothetical protein